jgi:hypothetical protein
MGLSPFDIAIVIESPAATLWGSPGAMKPIIKICVTDPEGEQGTLDSWNKVGAVGSNCLRALHCRAVPITKTEHKPSPDRFE